MKNIAIGQKAITKRTFAPGDIAEYVAIAGLDTSADARVVPAPLLGSLFSFLLGTQLPGRGTNYLKQSLQYGAPAYVGEELTATVEVVRVRPEKDLVNLKTTCLNPAGVVVCEGEALVLVRDVA